MFPGAFGLVRASIHTLRRVLGSAYATLWAEPARARGRLWIAGFYCRLFGGGWLALSAFHSTAQPALAFIGVAWGIERILTLRLARVASKTDHVGIGSPAELEPDD